ncbi:uncharacterized protein LOC143289652 [Babylonia areolata]|uniref:uncharacterized protein LOC143289652 n=1 Tax=Babylonia areolata TaxID=304850 RepID=UPI003FCF814C
MRKAMSVVVPDPDGGGQTNAHLPFWEPGSGHYGNTMGQYSRAVVDDCQQLVLSFLASVPVEKSAVFTVADYGANDGYSSMQLMESIIRHVKKKRGEMFPVQVIYEDQERNDFNSLFIRLLDKSSFKSKFPHVYPMATNINFYEQCVPDGTCDVIFTSMTTHWLHSLDVKFKDCVFFSSLKDDDTDTQKKVRQAAEHDWVLFLLHRARELKPGGIMVVLSLSAFDEYRNAGSEPETPSPPKCKKKSRGDGPVYHQGVGGNDVRRDLDAAWRTLRDRKRITQEEFEHCTSTSDVRTAREITAPFETVTSPVREAGLSMIHHDQIVYPFVAKEVWRDRFRKDGVDDRKTYVKNMTSAHRAWSESTFRGSLSRMRSVEEKNAILDELYDIFEAGLQVVDPEDYNTDYIISRLVVRKGSS